ncbi:hypothetical protein [Streptomyces sp. NPDC001091]
MTCVCFSADDTRSVAEGDDQVIALWPDIDAGELLVIAVATGSMDEIKAIAEALRDLAEPPL